MAKKAKTVYVCNECGYESPKWMGQCPACNTWNSFFEEKIADEKAAEDKRSRVGASRKTATGGPLREVKTGTRDRIDTGIGELNRVLGGGMVKGSLILISGEPGIGKSTIILQAAGNIAREGTVLYVSGEESEEQIKLRADRILGNIPEALYVMSETNIENISDAVKKLEPSFIIIDSIQTMYTDEIDSAPGSVSQVRTCGNELMRLGKVENIPIFIVAHVTKNGELAGPKIVEHLVDCVLSFTGERNQDIRILRCYKNRFGNTSEIGAFEMTGEGLVEIENLSGTFLEDMEDGTEGAVATAVYEGSRSMLLEIQALTVTAGAGFGRRTAIGIDHNRLAMILAVMEKKCNLRLGGQDVYVNVVGGLRPEGTYTDLAVALAVYSSLRSCAGSTGTIAIGELGLTGELRSVQNVDKILKEALRMGFKRVIMPIKNAARFEEYEGIEIVGVKNLREAIDRF